MKNYKVIEVKQSIFEHNNRNAEALRDSLRGRKIFLANVMSSPGAGKTSLLVATINALKGEYRFGVMEADTDGDCDSTTIDEKTGAKVIQLHTGGMCHLDAEMTQTGLEELGMEDVDAVFLENIGNLVCTAEFDTGASLNVGILSVPEGDDKPLKYPLIFSECDAVVISKIDTMCVFDFSLEAAKERILKLNPNAKVFPLSAKTGVGMEAWLAYLREQIRF